MPSDHGIWSNDEQGFAPIPPESGQQNPKQAIPILQSRPFASAIADLKLMAKGQVLEDESSLCLEPGQDGA